MKGAHYNWSWRVKTLALNHALHMEGVKTLKQATRLAYQWNARLKGSIFEVLEKAEGQFSYEPGQDFWLVRRESKKKRLAAYLQKKKEEYDARMGSGAKRRLKRIVSILIVFTLHALILSDSQAFDYFVYPGFYQFDCGGVEDRSLKACAARVEKLYSNFFPGQIHWQPEIHKMIGQGPPGIAARTILQRTNQDPYTVRMGRAYPKVSVEIYVDEGGLDNMDTIHHELTHDYDITLRGDGKWGNHFFEEGEAVMASWIIRPECLEGWGYLEILKRWVFQSKDARGFKRNILLRSDVGMPVRQDYPLAGFFMMQVLTYAGPSACKDFISNPREDYGALRQSLWAHSGMNEDEFWQKIWDNARTWTSRTYVNNLKN